MSFEVIAGLISILTFVSGLIAWLSAALKKQYAAERDFKEIQISLQELIRTNQFRHEFLKKELDEIECQIQECKSVLNTLLVRCCGDNISIGTRRRDTEG